MIRRLVTFLLILSFVTPALYNPYQARRAEAFLGIGDIVVDVKALIGRIFDGIAQAMAQRMIDDMVKSTVKWAQSGFDGNPTFATDPVGFLTRTADGVIGDFIGSDENLGFLCSPFQANIKLSLKNQYTKQKDFQCTLTEVVDNIDTFYGDFSQGGWDAWFSMTQNPTNNPYGAYLEARAELDARLASKLGLKKDELNWNNGFLSSKKCVGQFGGDGYYTNPDGEKVCLGTEHTTTPGTSIKTGLDKILPSGLEKLITAQHMDQLVSAFASGLLTRYVFGPRGLFASGNGNAGSSGGSTSDLDRRMGILDLNNDGIPDGQDSDRDGRLTSSTDICYHGGTPPNCVIFDINDPNASSPYFTPICQAINRAAFALLEYGKFMDKNAGQFKGADRLVGQILPLFSGGTGGGFLTSDTVFSGGGSFDDFKNDADADIWTNRTTEIDSVTDDILSTVRNYRAPYFDNLETTVNRFSAYITKVQESLIKDQDLDLGGMFSSGGGGLTNLVRISANNFKYINEAKTRLGRCDIPDLSGINSIPLPPEVGGGQCVEETGNQYAGALRQAMDAVLAANPSVANLPNTEANDRGNARTFLALVETQLISMGYQATDEVLNGNGNPSTGDIIAVWKTGDSEMERYDAISGSAATVGQAAQTNFAGFIPLNCTATGGGTDCTCEIDDGGGNIDPPPPPGGTPGGPAITSVNPNTVTPGTTTVAITGTNLTTTVQFFDYRGDPAGRSTVTGTLNAAGTQVTVLVPTGLLAGAGTIRIYRSATSYSNTLPITISGSAPSVTLTVATPTKVVVPTGIESVGYLGRIYNNGWWPSISPDGRYVAFGNWGDSYVLDLTSSSTKPAWNFKTPPGFPTPEEGGGRCIAGQWLSNTKLSFVCEIGPIANGGKDGFWRYEVTVGQWVPVKTADNPNNVVATIFKAKDNHWATYQAGPTFRIIKDNQVLATNAGGALSISGNTLVHACNNTNSNICVRDGSTLTKTYPVRTPLFSTATEGGYILYGGYGPVHGITPTGSDIDLTVSPSKTENPSEVFLVNGARWISTLTWNPPLDREYIILRPWGSRSAIVLDAPAVSASVVQKGNDLIVAYNDDQGNIKILTVPINAVRNQF